MKLIVCALGLGLSLSAMAQDAGTGTSNHRWHHHRGFGMGLCVGQALATQSPPVLLGTGTRTAAEKTAIKAAAASCKAQFKANKG